MKRKHRATLSPAVFSGLALTLASATLQAQTVWTGSGDGINYADPSNWAGDIIPGDGNNNGAQIGNSFTHSVIYNTATSYTSTGTGKANSLLVGTGTNGVGSLTLSGDAGALTFGGDGYNNAAWIGSTSGTTNATGTVTVSAGKLAITGGSDASINLGVSINAAAGAKSGTLIIDGGTVEVGRRILMGANNTATTGILTISSGTLDMKRTGLANEGDLGMIRFGSGNNTVNLDGGTVIFSGFHTTAASSARSTINLNGTTLKANTTIADLFNGTTTNTNLRLKDGGLVVDTNTFNVTINDALTQETGHTAILRKEGAGILTITGAQANRTGTTTVNGGTLRVSGSGSLGSGATTVSNSGSVLDLDRNDTWGNHAASTQALTIQSGGLVTNGSQVNRGYNTLQSLTLDGGELRVTGTARALVDGDLFKFEAFGIRNTVTVTGATASSITNPGNIANAGINIGGTTDLGGGIGSDLTIHVASTAELTISAVLKNNYDATAFNPLANGLVKTGGGTMTLSAANRYTGPTTVNEGSLVIHGAVASTAVFVNALLSGSGTMANATLSGSGSINPGNSAGIMTAAAIDPTGGLGFNFEFAAANTPPAWNMPAASGNDVLRLTSAVPFTAALAGSNAIGIYLNVASLNLGDSFTGAFFTDNNASFLSAISSASFQYFLADAGGVIGYNGVDYAPYAGPLGFRVATVAQAADFGAGEVNGFVTRITVIPEPGATLLSGLGLLALLRRRNR